MTIKQASLADLEAVTGLFDLYRQFQKQDSDPAGAEAFLKERLEREEAVIFLAESNQEAVGLALVYPLFSSVGMKRTWLLNDLYVKEDARSRGFGEQLIQAVAELARKTGAKGISLETCDDNFGAQRLYERLGFVKESNLFYFLSI